MNNNVSFARIIPEIYRLFNDFNGFSVVIAGDAGTGKTTFSLHLIEMFSDFVDAYYLSTRVNDDALLKQFKWLEEKAKNKDVSKPLIQNDKIKSLTLDVNKERNMNKVGTKYLDALISKANKLSDNTKNFIEYNKLPKISNMYKVVENNLPDPTFVVIDSINGLVDEYGIRMEDLVYAIQKDLVEGVNTKAIFVMEVVDSAINYLSDGFILFKKEYIDNRLVRCMELRKLRGVKISNPFYLFTLRDGRFYAPLPCDSLCKAYEYSYNVMPVQSKNSAKNGNIISTGIDEIDNRLLLEHGIAQGKAYMFRYHEPLTKEDSGFFLIPVIINAIYANYNIVFVSIRPPVDNSSVRMILNRELTTPEIRINHITRNITERSAPGIKHTYISEEYRQDIFTRNFLLTPFKNNRKNTIFIVNLDDVINIFKSDVYSILSLINEVRGSMDSIIIISRKGLNDSNIVADNINYTFDLKEIYNHITLYSSNPISPLYLLDINSKSDNAINNHIRLIDML